MSQKRPCSSRGQDLLTSDRGRDCATDKLRQLWVGIELRPRGNVRLLGRFQNEPIARQHDAHGARIIWLLMSTPYVFRPFANLSRTRGGKPHAANDRRSQPLAAGFQSQEQARRRKGVQDCRRWIDAAAGRDGRRGRELTQMLRSPSWRLVARLQREGHGFEIEHIARRRAQHVEAEIAVPVGFMVVDHINVRYRRGRLPHPQDQGCQF